MTIALTSTIHIAYLVANCYRSARRADSAIAKRSSLCSSLSPAATKGGIAACSSEVAAPEERSARAYAVGRAEQFGRGGERKLPRAWRAPKGWRRRCPRC